VVVVVDQMRADYLGRFQHLFEDGLARLIAEGAWFQGAEIAHGVTMTAPGHATISTGADPSHHGIIQNNWVDRASGAPAYAVADPAASIVGPSGVTTDGIEGRSPAALRRTTIGSWLKAASPESKVVAISYKDRASVLMGGSDADGVFWYEPGLGVYVTSSAFASALPEWVAAFDETSAVRDVAEAIWEKSLPEAAYAFAGEDTVAAEGEGDASRFPHRLVNPEDSTTTAFYRLGASPMSDGMSLDLATKGLEGAGLGADEHPDLLMLSLSGADLVGHSFGPDSHEMVDYYARLDHRLGDLLRELDRRAWGAYTLVLTADHGGTRMPEVARERGHADAQRISREVFDREVEGALARASERLGLAQLGVVDVSSGLWIENADLEAAKLAGKTAAQVRSVVAEEVRELAFVADAFSYEELADPSVVAAQRQPWSRRYAAGFVADRSPDVQVHGREGWLVNTYPTGTAHGSPYADDTEVPLIFFGAGISAQTSDAKVYTRDVAPTIAEFLGIAAPEVDGRSLVPLLRAAGDGAGDDV